MIYTPVNKSSGKSSIDELLSQAPFDSGTNNSFFIYEPVLLSWSTINKMIQFTKHSLETIGML